jgi:hypothetical protein
MPDLMIIFQPRSLLPLAGSDPAPTRSARFIQRQQTVFSA